MINQLMGNVFRGISLVLRQFRLFFETGENLYKRIGDNLDPPKKEGLKIYLSPEQELSLLQISDRLSGRPVRESLPLYSEDDLV